jgi:hypothetical protein
LAGKIAGLAAPAFLPGTPMIREGFFMSLDLLKLLSSGDSE